MSADKLIIDPQLMAVGMLQSACMLGMTEFCEPVFDKKTLDVAQSYCHLFVRGHKEDLIALTAYPSFWDAVVLPDQHERLLGHCLWVDACDHGCGFDSNDDLPLDLVGRLLAGAQRFAEINTKWHLESNKFVLQSPSAALVAQYSATNDEPAHGR